MTEGFKLTSGQYMAVKGCTDWFSQPGGPVMKLLSGYAGCGKTTTISHMAREGIIQGRTVMCAPTHKAVKVMWRTMAEIPNMFFATIHSLLCVKPVDSEDGSRPFESWARPGAKIPLHNYDNIILDEVSMLDDGLFDILMGCKLPNQRIMFCGDRFQLQPVSHKTGVLSIPFRNPQDYHIQTHELDEIVRQREENTIIPFATEIRNQRWPGDDSFGKNIRRVQRGSLPPYALKVYQSEEYRDNPDRLKFLAYTNKVVDNYNRYMHSTLYGTDSTVTPIAVGERMILRAAYPITDTLSFQNNEELLVLERKIGTFKMEYTHGQLHIEKDLQVMYLTVQNEVNIQATVMIVMDEQFWKDVMDKLFNKIRYTYFDNKKKAWGQYWELKAKVAEWKHCYAQTIHTSQGSTYYEAAVDVTDVGKNKTEEYWHLLYTGVTRPSERLIIV